MSVEKPDMVIDFDKPKEEVIRDLNKLVKDSRERIEKEGQIALNFLLKKKGEKEKKIVYNLNKDLIDGFEKEFVFPKVIEEVVKKEFNPKIAQNEKLMSHIMGELKKDPYWTDRVVNLIKTIKEKEK